MQRWVCAVVMPDYFGALKAYQAELFELLLDYVAEIFNLGSVLPHIWILGVTSAKAASYLT